MPQVLDVAIVGGGIGGLAHLVQARRAGLAARVFERAPHVGGLWAQLPAWQDIQIAAADWTLQGIPIEGTAQPAILANIRAWVDVFGLQDGLALGSPVHARHDGTAWQLDTPQGRWQASHLVACTGGHNRPVVPAVRRDRAEVQELHSSALRDPAQLQGRDVLVVGGGASALDLLDLALQHGASRVRWVHRGVRWFTPTGKPKAIAGSVRPFARMQASGMSHQQQNATLNADLQGRYAKFGIEAIRPSRPFDVLHDQLFPGRHRMLAQFRDIEQHLGTVERIEGRTVRLSDGTSLQPDFLLWGTGYAMDLGWLDVPALQEVRSVDALLHRCGGVWVSLDAPRLYFPGVGLDGIGATAWAYSVAARSLMSHIRGTARLDTEPVPHKVNHFDMVEYLAPRDPASYPGDWRARYRALALETPDDVPYPMPA